MKKKPLHRITMVCYFRGFKKLVFKVLGQSSLPQDRQNFLFINRLYLSNYLNQRRSVVILLRQIFIFELCLFNILQLIMTTTPMRSAQKAVL